MNVGGLYGQGNYRYQPREVGTEILDMSIDRSVQRKDRKRLCDVVVDTESCRQVAPEIQV